MFEKLEIFGPKITYGGSALAGGTGLAEATQVIEKTNISDIGIVVGMVCAVVGVIIQFYFAHQRNKREKEIHDERNKK